MKHLKLILKIIITLAIILLVIKLGGYYGGKMIGLLVVAAVAYSYIIFIDSRNIMHRKKCSRRKATLESLKNNLKFIFK